MENPTGKLSLVFRRKANHQTYLAKQYFKLPLQIMTPHYQDDDGTAFVYLLNPSGGILQHDRLFTEITVEESSKALVTTPSSAKLYKMDEGCATLINHITVRAGGVLEYLPENNVPFAQPSTYQETEFHLDESSVLIASDMVTAGRISRGEIFDYNIYSSKTKIYVNGKLAAYDSSAIEPKKISLNRLGMLEGFLTNGTMYIYAQNIAKDLSLKINRIESGETVSLGASNVSDTLMIVRFMGTDMPDLQNVHLKAWDIVRRTILGKPSVRMRKF